MIKFTHQYRGTFIGQLDKRYSNTRYVFGWVPGGFIDVMYCYCDTGKIIESYYILDNELLDFIERRRRKGWQGMLRTKNDTNNEL